MTNQDKQHIYCVILAGGIGTRFWPMSTTKNPKQFHDVLGTGKTLIQQTYDRLLQITDKDRIFVITDEIYGTLVNKQLPDLNPNQIIKEPMAMNTAACVLYAAFKINNLDPKSKILVCPSDHLIINENIFAERVNQVLEGIKEKDGLYTLGIQPTRPDTGYGYIQFIDQDKEIKKVKTFTEKPNREMAEKFLLTGEFLWNSGIFIWSSQAILKAFEKFLPEMYQRMNELWDDFNTPKEEEKIKKVYPFLQKVSIDIGILEKSEEVYVLPVNFGWSDLGTWTSLYENIEKDQDKNGIKGNLVKMYDSKGNMVLIEKQKAVVIEGLENYIVVDTPNGLLICPFNSDQEVKNYVNDLKLSKGDKFV